MANPNPRQPLATGQLTTTASDTSYTVGANTTAQIIKLTFTNTSASAVTVTVYICKSGGSVANNTTLTSAKSIAAGDTWLCPESVGHYMEAGSFIQMKASAATSITPFLSVLERV